MATFTTMAMLKPAAKIVARAAPSTSGSTKSAPVSISLRSLHKKATLSSPSAAAAMAGAFFSALASSDAAFAAQHIADMAAASAAPVDDNRGKLLLVVVAPAIGWVLYNILQPALNQLNRMRSQAVVAGLGGLGVAAGMACAPQADAVQEVVAAVAAAAPAEDNRGTLLLIVVAPAIGWVLYNILQPALNQLNRMRND